MKRRMLMLFFIIILLMPVISCQRSQPAAVRAQDGPLLSPIQITTQQYQARAGLLLISGSTVNPAAAEAAWEGLQKARNEFELYTEYVKVQSAEEGREQIHALAEKQVDLLFIYGDHGEETVEQGAGEYPHIHFVLIDGQVSGDFSNVTCLRFDRIQAAYLSGVLAGLATKTNEVGFIAGQADESVNQLAYGYFAGVLDANSKARIWQQNINTYSDAAAAKETTLSLAAQNADIIFHAAGDAAAGIIEGCRESGAKSIGAYSYRAPALPETEIAAASGHVDEMVYAVTQRYLKKQLDSGVVTGNLANEGVGIQLNEPALPEVAVLAVRQVEEKMKAAKIIIPATKADFEAAYGEVYTLD